jgi:glutaredoxin 3
VPLFKRRPARSRGGDREGDARGSSPAPEPPGRLSLYTIPWCAYCDRVKDELARLDLDYEEITVPASRFQRDEIYRLTGQRQVPVLVEGDLVLHESSRIVAHLQQKQARTEST